MTVALCASEEAPPASGARRMFRKVHQRLAEQIWNPERLVEEAAS